MTAIARKPPCPWCYGDTYSSSLTGDDPVCETCRMSASAAVLARDNHRFIELASALSEMPRHTLWAVGSMEDGPFCRLCWPMPDGSYLGGYVEAYEDTPALSVLAAIEKGKAVAAIAAGSGTAKTPKAVECEASQSGAQSAIAQPTPSGD